MRKVYTSAGAILVQPEAWDSFSAHYKQIYAAGGVIVNEANGDVLFIFRNQRWDLPKGKQEAGEPIEQTAIREVQEECGIPAPTLGTLLCETYHTYTIDTDSILKKTSWFRMSLAADQVANLTFKPQLEEGIEKVVWIPESQAHALANSSFGTIQDVLNAFLNPQS